MRIHKFLAHAGVASRRKSEALVEEGKVTINGGVAKIGDIVDPEHDVVKIGAKLIELPSFIYYVLHKPRGYVSTTNDPHGRKTVLDLLPKSARSLRLYPVGRLDYDSEGLMIMTNDGDFANLLTHPRYQVDKTYEVLVRGNPSDEKLEMLEVGINLEDGRTAPASISRAEINENSNNWIEVTIREGKKRQIRRMFEKIGHPVQQLIRRSIGWINLGELETCAYRSFTPDEYAKIAKWKQK